ncbi:hypothetical protein J2R76_008190 [Bradyrhizobium sp. USDA 4532]|nr:hypothetical protein [Bradyrhizobium sp. USDA 4545]MCP1924599.1 hypothetical protein [Bradyrhizobium sp. USDA 4532]
MFWPHQFPLDTICSYPFGLPMLSGVNRVSYLD